MKNRRIAAYTLLEMLIAAAVGSVLGGIIYVVATEGVTSFARNASLNRGYTDARSSIEQITSAVQSAGTAPTLIDANGIPVTIPASGPPAAEGVRFYRYGSLPSYEIASGKSSDAFLTVNFTSAQALSSGASPINVGDLVAIPLLSFQAVVTSATVSASGTGGSVKLTFNTSDGTINRGLPLAAPAATATPTPTPISLAYAPSPSPAVYYTALVYQQVAFIAVPNGTGGAQLRYYPHAMSNSTTGTAGGGLAAFNGPTYFGNTKNYSVIASIAGTVTDASLTPLKPFQILLQNPNPPASPSPTPVPVVSAVLKVTLCAEGPDYNNRNLNASNTYSLMQSSMASRCPILLRSSALTPF